MTGKIAMSVHLVLYTNDGAPLGKVFDYSSPATFLFGRDPSSHYSVVDDPVVSRKHYFMEISPPNVRLHDLGSRNGVRVNDVLFGGKNGRRAANGTVPPIDLHPGDRVRVGKTVVEIQLRDDASQQPASADESDSHEVDNFAATVIVPRTGATIAGSSAPPSAASGIAQLLGNYSASDAPLPRIPGYSLSRVLGKGGMGTVYLGTREDGSETAVKVLHPSQTVSETSMQRFRREISITRALFHKNIVSCVDDGCVDGVLYLAMEFMRHGSLADRLLNTGALTPEAARPYMLQMLEGLAHAHSRDIVHRDLKPANVLFGGERGEVAKLTDFGLAKSFVDAGMSNFTVTGTAAGTLTCLPPEQLLDFKRVLPASDVFSIGATFYEMLTNRSPFNLRPDSDAFSAILSFDLTPLAERRPDLPAPLTSRIDRALRENPAERYQNGAEMLEEFRGW